jgi:hypothetical protein
VANIEPGSRKAGQIDFIFAGFKKSQFPIGLLAEKFSWENPSTKPLFLV